MLEFDDASSSFKKNGLIVTNKLQDDMLKDLHIGIVPQSTMYGIALLLVDNSPLLLETDIPEMVAVLTGLSAKEGCPCGDCIYNENPSYESGMKPCLCLYEYPKARSLIKKLRSKLKNRD